MWSFVRQFKAAWNWATSVWQLVVFLGISGGIISFVATVWAIVLRLPPPIIIAIGFCTLVSAVYLAMAPLAHRVLSAVPKQTVQRPDYKPWKLLPALSIYEAAHLWCDIDPAQPAPSSLGNPKAWPWLRVLTEQVKNGKLDFIPPDMLGPPYNVNPTVFKRDEMKKAGPNTKITRAELQKFAKEIDENPVFLRN